MTTHPRGRGATIYSVAEAAGVSIATVSRVLQGSSTVAERTRAKVIEAADRLEYVPHAAARSLAVRHHEALGLVLPELYGPYYSELIMGFETTAAEVGLGVMVTLHPLGSGDPAERIARVATRVDGLAVLGAVADEAGEALRRVARQKPLVVLAGTTTATGSLRTEGTDAAASLTTHLLADHGRERLLFVGDPQGAPDIHDRFVGFTRALEAHGRPVPDPVAVTYQESSGREVAERLLAGYLDADALVCANDELALAVTHRLQDGGWDVPGRIAVTGWDDVMASRYVRPGLTTVAQPVRDLGALAVRRLHERITGSPMAATTDSTTDLLPSRVVRRGSCGCPEPPLP